MIKILTTDYPIPRRKHVIYYNGENSYQQIMWDNHVEYPDGRTMFYNRYYSCTFEDKKFSKIKIVWNWFAQMILGVE